MVEIFVAFFIGMVVGAGFAVAVAYWVFVKDGASVLQRRTNETA